MKRHLFALMAVSLVLSACKDRYSAYKLECPEGTVIILEPQAAQSAGVWDDPHLTPLVLDEELPEGAELMVSCDGEEYISVPLVNGMAMTSCTNLDIEDETFRYEVATHLTAP